MIIHLLAPKDQTKWPDIWHHCYNIWESIPYKIKLWGDKDIDQLLKEDDEEFFNILDTLNPVYKWDYVRYLILEKFGGAYFDVDIEVIDGSFFNKLIQDRIYLMEGTTGTYVENSIMITPSNLALSEYWKRLKKYSQYIIKSSPTNKLIKENVIWKVGPGLLSKFFLDHHLNTKSRQWEILGYQQFGSKTNNVVYTRHHQTAIWD